MARKLPNTWPEALPEAQPLICALCHRETPTLTQHHLLPISQGRRRGVKIQDLPTVELCAACHKYLHTTFTNSELAGPYNSLEALQGHEGVQKFVAWIRKQPATKGVKVR